MKDENIQMKCRIGGGALWQGPHPRDPTHDEGAWLRTDGSPTDEDHGPVLHLGNTEHAWGGEGKRAGKRVHCYDRWTPCNNRPMDSEEKCPLDIARSPRTGLGCQASLAEDSSWDEREVRTPLFPSHPVRQPERIWVPLSWAGSAVPTSPGMERLPCTSSLEGQWE